MSARRSGPLRGKVRVPGDKSISHRALIFGALTVGKTQITGLLEGEDVLHTADTMRALGAQVERVGERGAGEPSSGVWQVHGVGVAGFREPREPLDFGNSGTGCRLVMGAVAGCPITATFDGDASLRTRPMRRILDPVELMGARTVSAADGGRLPITIAGARDVIPIVYRTPVPSAQIKSAVLLAGLAAPGETSVIESEASRDHTERLLAHFGAQVTVEPLDPSPAPSLDPSPDGTRARPGSALYCASRASPTCVGGGQGGGGRKITLTGQPELAPAPVAVPADPSSAAFPMVAALIVPGSELILTDVMTNPLRTGLITTLREMGADIEMLDVRSDGGEEMADYRVRASALRGVEVPPARAPSMIDEYPVLAVAAAFAEGTTIMRGLHELRVKESDRLAAVAEGLRRNGVELEIMGDDLIVHGSARAPGGGEVASHMDHRIAMAFLVMGLASERPVAIDDAAIIATSFPNFVPLMRRLGADLS
jgi:3-phosphoshikimate 1-carboxyvinyltransferase